MIKFKLKDEFSRTFIFETPKEFIEWIETQPILSSSLSIGDKYWWPQKQLYMRVLWKDWDYYQIQNEYGFDIPKEKVGAWIGQYSQHYYVKSRALYYKETTRPRKWYVGYRKRRYAFIRHPKTIQEIRALEDSDFQEYHIRVRRKKVDLPTAWDDICRKNYRNHNWKQFRKTRYKSV